MVKLEFKPLSPSPQILAPILCWPPCGLVGWLLISSFNPCLWQEITEHWLCAGHYADSIHLSVHVSCWWVFIDAISCRNPLWCGLILPFCPGKEGQLPSWASEGKPCSLLSCLSFPSLSPAPMLEHGRPWPVPESGLHAARSPSPGVCLYNETFY